MDLKPHAEGCVLAVRCQPGARRQGLVGDQAGALKVAVTAPADKGRANEALVEVLADLLDLRKEQVELISGHASRAKKFLLRMPLEEVRVKIEQVLKR